MKKYLFTLFALATMAQASWAQGFYYDIWFDSNRGAMTHGTFVPGENELTLDLSGVNSAGLHFLNVIPYFEWGVMGQWRCIPFIMPEGWPHTTNAQAVEYWVTGYDSKPKRMAYSGTEIPLDIEISGMSYGLHFLNFRTFNEVGEAGPWKVIMFYLSNGRFDPEEMTYEYWIDSNEPQTGTGYFPGELPLKMDVSELTDGKHTFNFKAKNWFESYGELFSVKFDKKAITTGVAETEAPKQLSIRATDGVFIVESKTERDLAVYQANGVLVRKVHLSEGQTVISNLPKGIYMMEGLKLVLR